MSKKTHNGYGVIYDNKGFVPVDSRLPHWNPGNPNLSWGPEGISGIKGKRYLYYPASNFYVNEDGTVKAFGKESIPIVSKHGTNYIDVPASGDKATSTWDTGHGIYTVQNYYRIPIGTTTKYVEPPVLQPKPKQTEEIQKTVEKNTKPVIIKPKLESKLKPKPTLVKKPIPIPEDMKKGLTKVVDGVPQYEIKGDPEQIEKLIEEYMKTNPTEDDNIYIDTPTISKHSDTEDQKQNNTSKSTTDPSQTDTEDIYFRTQQTRTLPTVNVKEGDEGAYLYKYPHRRVNIYKVSPELAKYIQDNLSNNTQSQGSELKKFIYSTVPLQNLPNGELNDTIFHNIFTLPKNSEWIDFFDGNIAHDIRYQYADEAVAQGYHTNDGQPVTLLDDYPILEGDELPIEDNKVFVRQFYFRDTAPFKYSSHYIPYPDHTQSYNYYKKNSEDMNIPDFATDINGKQHLVMYPSFSADNEYSVGPLRDIVPIQSYQAVKDSLDQVNHSVTQNDTSGVGGLFRRLIGRNSQGGKLNYLNLFKQ